MWNAQDNGNMLFGTNRNSTAEFDACGKQSLEIDEASNDSFDFEADELDEALSPVVQEIYKQFRPYILQHEQYLAKQLKRKYRLRKKGGFQFSGKNTLVVKFLGTAPKGSHGLAPVVAASIKYNPGQDLYDITLTRSDVKSGKSQSTEFRGKSIQLQSPAETTFYKPKESRGHYADIFAEPRMFWYGLDRMEVDESSDCLSLETDEGEGFVDCPYQPITGEPLRIAPADESDDEDEDTTVEGLFSQYGTYALVFEDDQVYIAIGDVVYEADSEDIPEYFIELHEVIEEHYEGLPAEIDTLMEATLSEYATQYGTELESSDSRLVAIIDTLEEKIEGGVMTLSGNHDFSSRNREKRDLVVEKNGKLKKETNSTPRTTSKKATELVAFVKDLLKPVDAPTDEDEDDPTDEAFKKQSSAARRRQAKQRKLRSKRPRKPRSAKQKRGDKKRARFMKKFGSKISKMNSSVEVMTLGDLLPEATPGSGTYTCTKCGYSEKIKGKVDPEKECPECGSIMVTIEKDAKPTPPAPPPEDDAEEPTDAGRKLSASDEPNKVLELYPSDKQSLATGQISIGKSGA